MEVLSHLILSAREWLRRRPELPELFGCERGLQKRNALGIGFMNPGELLASFVIYDRPVIEEHANGGGRRRGVSKRQREERNPISRPHVDLRLMFKQETNNLRIVTGQGKRRVGLPLHGCFRIGSVSEQKRHPRYHADLAADISCRSASAHPRGHLKRCGIRLPVIDVASLRQEVGDFLLGFIQKTVPKKSAPGPATRPPVAPAPERVPSNAGSRPDNAGFLIHAHRVGTGTPCLG